MELVDYIFSEPQQDAAKISTYDEQFIPSKVDDKKVGEKRFLFNAKI